MIALALALLLFDQGALTRAGSCSLPSRFDPKALQASGWK